MKRQILMLIAALALFVTGAKADFIYYTISGVGPGGDSWSGQFNVGSSFSAVTQDGNTLTVSASGAHGGDTLQLDQPGSLYLDSGMGLVAWRDRISNVGALWVFSPALFSYVNDGLSWDDLVTINSGTHALTRASFDNNSGVGLYNTFGTGQITFSYSSPSAVPEPGMAGLAIFGGLLVVGVGRWVKGGSRKSPVAA